MPSTYLLTRGDVTRTFSFAVPIETPPGEIRITAAARDQAQHEATPAVHVIQLVDDVAPIVVITTPAAGTFDPRNPIDVTVEATDVGLLAEVGLETSGTFDNTETRAVAPPSASAVESFQIIVQTKPKQLVR